jgi:hypothetical protein
MEKALERVIEGHMSFQQAVEAFEVPKSTLYNKYRGRNGGKLGRPPILSVLEEKKCCEYCNSCQFIWISLYPTTTL